MINYSLDSNRKICTIIIGRTRIWDSSSIIDFIQVTILNNTLIICLHLILGRISHIFIG
jgi:hypothetical protein